VAQNIVLRIFQSAQAISSLSPFEPFDLAIPF
jgi:hypothetical protein